ncbi:MAG: GH36-type glycosyl hydrolase domain-containing protein [Candidatus Acidiferrales bacterium]
MSATATFPTVFANAEEPIRAELFSTERLEQHAETLAAAQIVSESKQGRPLAPRVWENGRILLQSYRSLAEAVRQGQEITAAAEWLVDNFHIIDEQLREIRDDLPQGYYRELPKLDSGPFQGFPRVFGVAWAFVAHTDSRFDPEILRRFVKAYQRVQPLTIGELWAVAITLRVVLVENLRRLAERIVDSRAARQEANALADRLLGVNGQARVPLESALPRFETTPLAPPFAVELVQRLRDPNPNVRPIVLWLEGRLKAQNITAEEIIRAEHQQQAAMNVTVRNIITSMRLMSAFNWKEFFESVSLVDEILCQETNFSEMDFSTRDTYRHALEDLSKGSKYSEIEVAQRVVRQIRHARSQPHNGSPLTHEQKTDPGHYLISRGRPELEQELEFRPTLKRRLLRWYMRSAVPGYLGTIAVLTVLILALPLLHDADKGAGWKSLLFLGIFAAFPASDLAIALINRAVAELLGPRTLPRMELKYGVPESLRTLVVMPTLLIHQDEIEEQIGRLEVHYLSNSDGNLYFGLLSDWVDAPSEQLPEDDALLAAATAGIARLNKRYESSPNGIPRFFLFHRKRIWNEQEQKWMGWERKRGKLHELNQLLRGSVNTSFLATEGRPTPLIEGVRYVITLDADTRMPRGVAARLVGTMAHPLNRPKIENQLGRVVEGYGLVQPRITPTLPTGGEGSLYQKIFSGPSGIDPYSAAISDVYQDLFQEGSYTGKGIYDVDAFEGSLAGKVPENCLLSHDLFEGVFARTALVSDIELFEEFPAHYEASAKRQHRWARGDWQLLPWIFGRGPVKRGKQFRVNLPAIGRWKMIDNLRRTLSAPASFLTLLLGWLLPSASPWVWTRFVLATIAIPPLIPFLAGLNPRFGGISKRSHLRSVFTDLALSLSQIGLMITFLAYQGWLMSDAIVRTLARLVITQKKLLEWVTAAQAKYAVDFQLFGMYKHMAGGILLALITTAALAFGRHQAWPAALPFIILWAAAPAAARWISLPPRSRGYEPVSVEDARYLRTISRRTWRFFETFVTGEDHFLPPDNFQEVPKPIIAHRTSPTNIGLYLLSVLAARDFGWSGTLETADRLEVTLATIRNMEKYRGHLYNWYDTRDLRPLEPKYISSVDSGNLAGHLLALANGCRELVRTPTFGAPLLEGMEDSLRLLREAHAGITEKRRTQTVTRKQLGNAIDALSAALHPIPVAVADWVERFYELRTRAQTVSDIAQTFVLERGDSGDPDLRYWAEAVRACVESHFRDLEILIPWTRLSATDIALMARRPLEEVPEWAAIEPYFRFIPSLEDAPDRFAAVLRDLGALRSRLVQNSVVSKETIERIDRLSKAFQQSETAAASLIRRLTAATQACEHLFNEMDFSFLFDESRELFSIGFRLNDSKLDESYYDMLASEAHLTSFIAIAKGDVPSSHWFQLGRSFTPVSRGSALLSWSGSMFEYLMPALVLSTPAGSLLNQTKELVVRRQIAYGAERHVPWGVSESAFNVRDLDLTYQYMSFGVPGLGLKRGLSEDIVVAPYATALAAMVDPAAAAHNFEKLDKAGGSGPYGFYEALDYTARRLPEGKDVAVVRAFLAHHQGMSLVALDNVLNNGVMRTRFHAEPMVQATELLLQERTPRDVLVSRPRAEEVSAARVRELTPPAQQRFASPHDATPRTQLLSNGRYSVMVTASGSGFSRWRDIAITRWREDVTRDCWGSYIFLRDLQSGQVWSAGYQPLGIEADSYEACFYEDRVEIVRRDRSLSTSLEIVVSSEDDAEMRRVSISNLGVRTREIQITSYAEVCLAPQAADVSHPAFSNLFVQTEFDSETGALLATRRKRSAGETSVWAAQVVAVEGQAIGELQYETDRAKFIGRGNNIRNPVSVLDGQSLSNTVGSVLDPVFSLRRTVRVAPGTVARLVFSTVVAGSREEALGLADKYRDARNFERILTLAWTQAQVELHHLGISIDEAHLFQRLANAVIYTDAPLRPSADLISSTSLELGALWGQGISGDLPIVVAVIEETEDMEMIRQLLRAHEYWRMKQLSVDVVIFNDKSTSYTQELQDSLAALVRSSQLRLAPNANGVRGNIYLLRADLITPQERKLFEAAARVVLLSRRGTLADQVNRAQRVEPLQPPAIQVPTTGKNPDALLPSVDLEFFNGLGGFTENGSEYMTTMAEGLRTPQPWINVIANPQFGFIVSESGCSNTWSMNSHENQLTPWSNDPVGDSSGEAFYIRDEGTGEIWSPTALPIRDEAAHYVARHGQGYSRFQNGSRGIFSDLLQFVPAEDSLKVSRLTLQNSSNRTRRLSVTAYVEWVLGNSRSAAAPYIITELDSQTKAIFARNAWSGEFGGRIAFADLAGRQSSWTADRTEFLGRNGAPESPAALRRGIPLSGKTGSCLDPCAAMQTSIELRPGARVELIFFLGQCENREAARELIARYRAIDLNAVFRDMTSRWDDILGAVQVSTPDRALDILLNRWLLYQTLSCRIWGRAAFYQLSGAYGFRDQLQDVMALNISRREVFREQLIRAASHQFLEGDVQHWWHPPLGRGVRTRFSDDLLWLPYAVIQYLETTSDTKTLDEMVPFLEGEELAEGQEDAYFQPRVSDRSASLFEHCARALDRSLGIGVHGLPLMGTGDWNDGMNRVGREGKGESIWLGWFLHTILLEFAKIADARGERTRAEIWRLHVFSLKAALEKDGWDGEWYRRAYFDDGTPLGSSSNTECRIDSIAQSWGVISGAAEKGRVERAMTAVERNLIRKPEKLILLLTPPFDHMTHDPGYIMAYVPGIRENGGQYTHAAVWTTIAFAALGDGDKAFELFSMINPIHRATSRTSVQRYKVEPYVVAGDIYGEPPHAGRGGWTWYTGAAGWMYRAGIEWILGFRVRGTMLSIDPCIPREWSAYSITFRYHSSTYKIRVENPSSVTRGVALTKVDGNLLAGSAPISLIDDGAEHEVLVVLG